MYAVQISKSRKAYQTVTGPTSFNGAYDTYSALVNYQAPKGSRVRLVSLEDNRQPKLGQMGYTTRVVRSAEALGTSIASLWSR